MWLYLGVRDSDNVKGGSYTSTWTFLILFASIYIDLCPSFIICLSIIYHPSVIHLCLSSCIHHLSSVCLSSSIYPSIIHLCLSIIYPSHYHSSMCLSSIHHLSSYLSSIHPSIIYSSTYHLPTHPSIHPSLPLSIYAENWHRPQAMICRTQLSTALSKSNLRLLGLVTGIFICGAICLSHSFSLERSCIAQAGHEDASSLPRF